MDNQRFEPEAVLMEASAENILYLDCSSGISGDMLVGALLDLGADEQELREALASLPLDGYRIEISRVKKSGIAACDFNVALDEAHENHDHDMTYLHGVAKHLPEDHASLRTHHEGEALRSADDAYPVEDHAALHAHHGDEASHAHPHGRGLDEITSILYSGLLSDRALALALKIFQIVAEAEAKVHDLPMDQVHFHEVGAVDSIIDIAAIAVCIDNLKVSRVIIPSLTEGTGQIRCQHGLLPIPVPATAAIAAAHQLPLHISGISGELVTPTGAAAAAALRTDFSLPELFTIQKTGIGAGKRDYATAGILRAMLIRSDAQPEPAPKEEIIKLETNLDDCSGEALGFVMEELLHAEALDVFFTPIYMKKNRPGTLLTVLCSPEDQSRMETIIFRHTTGIGIRRQVMQRTRLAREARTIDTPFGAAKVKVCEFRGERYCYPEHESVAALARAQQLSYIEVFQAVKTIATTALLKEM